MPQAPREVKPDPDRDGDGIVDRLDRCPFDAEDQDGFEDQDGCPDRDNDGDCVADAQDRCPSTPGLRENQGCPDEDQDRDGIVDRLDRCPAQAEDADGFEDQDGCPDPDNDKDGVLDAADRCPVSAGPAENQGCPDEDKDKDTIVDRLDQCPLEPGVAPDGCPKRQFIAVQADRIELREQIRFATGKAKIRPDSFGLLDEVVEVLKRRGDLRLRILGHTDNKGKREKNLKLSADRAAAVRDYLIGKGIDGGRLSSEGLGPDQLLQDNKTSQGREANRRTEFFIVK